MLTPATMRRTSPNQPRRRRPSPRKGWAVVASLLTLGAVTATAYAHDTTGRSTLEQTLIGEDQTRIGDPSDERFSFLQLGPGERYVVREQLAQARSGRSNRRRSVGYFGQLTDFQLSDEESPARVEFFNADPSDFGSSAFRPQEALVAHQVELTIRQVNRFLQSPVRQGNGRRARLANAVLTGDLADNQHRNETDWVVQLLEGGEFVNGERVDERLEPNSGSSENADYDGAGCPPSGTEERERLKQEAPNYTGVQDYDDYPTAPVGNTEFYDPDRPDGQYRDWPNYKGLLDRAQKPFRTEGLKVPSYVLFGNHDGLAQGNEDAIAPFEDVGTGCAKVFPITNFPSFPGSPLEFLSAAPENSKSLVPPDEARQFVDKRQFKALHDTGKQADEHGFGLVDPGQLRASNGTAAYYSFKPETPGRDVRFIMLDTLSEGGVAGDSSNGNIDDPQFRWLRRELRQAQSANELIVVFGHHATGSLTSSTPDEAAAPCTVDDEHGHDTNPGCDQDRRASTPLHDGDDLIELFHGNPNVISYVAGHSHENQVQAFERGNGGGFWEIKSPAIVDWPAQHRLLEVMDNRDGTLSIFGTLLDHDGPSRSPGTSTEEQVGGFDADTLASIGRTLAYNDPQEGPDGSEGERRDRNVELLLRDPRVEASDDGGGSGGGDGSGGSGGDSGDGGGSSGGGDGSGGGARASGGSDGDDATSADFDPAASETGDAPTGTVAGDGDERDGELPFTGLALGALLVLGLALSGVGYLVRRRARG